MLTGAQYANGHRIERRDEECAVICQIEVYPNRTDCRTLLAAALGVTTENDGVCLE